MADDEQARKLYTEYQALSQQAKQMQEFLQETGENVRGLGVTIEALQEFSRLEGKEKMLAPIANGIFVEAIVKETQHLHMNVGDGTVVKKSVPEAVAVLERQRQQLEEMRKNAEAEYVTVSARLQAIEKLVG